MSEFSESKLSGIKLTDVPPGDQQGSSLNAFEETRGAQESGTHGRNSLDSILRVPSPESVHEALCRLFYDVVRERGTTVAEFRPSLEASAAKLAKIAIKTKGKILFFNPAEVFAVEAHGNHVLLRRQSDSYLLRQPISIVEAKLKQCGFLRIHRSVLINASWVEEIRPWTTGDCVLRLSGKKEYTVSRTYRKNLGCLAQSWIGTDLSAQEYLMTMRVLITAHDQHAVTAFEKHAVDCVLKPFSDERIHDALESAVRQTQTERAARLPELLPQMESLTKSSRIAIKTKGSILFVDPADVTVVEAQGNYVLLQRLSGSYLVRESTSTIAQKLESYGFIRIHRSILVNTSFVEEIHPWTTGEYMLRIKGGKEFTVSRTYKKNLKSLARIWIGTDPFMTE